MRTIRAIRRNVGSSSRSEYWAALGELGALLRAEGIVKGFYVTESAAAPGDFWEFFEFADVDAAARSKADEAAHPRWKALAERVAALEGARVIEDSLWEQRM